MYMGHVTWLKSMNHSKHLASLFFWCWFIHFRPIRKPNFITKRSESLQIDVKQRKMKLQSFWDHNFRSWNEIWKIIKKLLYAAERRTPCCHFVRLFYSLWTKLDIIFCKLPLEATDQTYLREPISSVWNAVCPPWKSTFI